MKIKLQKDYKDCGLVCIQAFSYEYHNVWHDINLLKSKAIYNEHGISGANLIKLGNQFGVSLEGYEGTLDDIIKSKMKKEFIALTKTNNLGHYVIAKIRGDKVFVLDPIDGEKKYSFDEFKEIFVNVFFIPKETILQKHSSTKSLFSFAFSNSNLTVVICLQMLLSLILTFTSTTFMKVIMDKVIPAQLTNTLNVIVITFTLIAILRIANNFIKGYLVEKINIRTNYELTNIYFSKLSTTKISELNKLSHSDHMRRIFLLSEVSSFIANTIFYIFNQGVSLIIATGLLIWISVKLFSIAFVVGALVIIVTLLFQAKFKTQVEKINSVSLEAMNISMEKINSFKEQKNPEYAAYFHKRFSDSTIKSTMLSQEVFNTKTLQSVISEFLNLLAPMLLTYVGTKEVFKNEITFGTLMMFLSIFNNFFSPLNGIALFVGSLSSQLKNVQLLSSILNFEDEQTNSDSLKIDKINSITLTPMTFMYDKPIFKTNGFKIDTNIHITGRNGSGKSSLLQLIAGNYFGTEQICVNNASLALYDLNSFRSKVYISTPNTFLPNGKVVDVITLSDHMNQKTLFENIEKYNLVDLLTTLNINFNIFLTNNGQNLSSGQKQIIHLLRLFSRKYDVIILDEALENIDESKMLFIKKALLDYQNEAIFIEVSHSKRYITKGKEVDIEKLAQNPY